MKTLLRVIFIALLLCSVVFIAKATDKVVDIADFSKYQRPDDATPMVIAAIDYCRKIKATKLVFSKKTYHFKRDLAVEKYVFMSNNDEGLKRFVFDLSGMENFEVDGQGAKFILTGFLSPFLLTDSHHIRFCNFSIDYTRTFHSEAKILSVDPEGIIVSLNEKFPYKIDHQTLLFTDSAGVVYPWSDLLEFDPLKKETAYMANDLWIGSNVPVKEISPGVLRLNSPKVIGTPGNVMVFASALRMVPAFNLSESSDIHFYGIDIFHCGGMGIVAQNSRDIFLDKVRVTPSPGTQRVVSITADATHFSNCSGKISIENCLFENQKDDATNIHGIYSRISRIVSPFEIEVELVHRQQFGFEYVRAGLPIEFVTGPGMNKFGDRKIDRSISINKQFTKVFFKEAIPQETKVGDAIASTKGYPEVLIRNCTIRGNRARGILLNSRGKTLVERNTFHVPGAAILFEGDASFWFEQSGVNGVIIRNNIFDNCNYGVWGNSCIQVGSGIAKDLRSAIRYHKDILIEHNTFKVFDPRILNLYCVDGITFKNNKILQSTAYTSKFPEERQFVIENCSNVSIEGFEPAKILKDGKK